MDKNPPISVGDTGSIPDPDDPTCHRSAKPAYHNYWSWALEPKSLNYWADVLQLLKSVPLEPMFCNKRSRHSKKPLHHNWGVAPTLCKKTKPLQQGLHRPSTAPDKQTNTMILKIWLENLLSRLSLNIFYATFTLFRKFKKNFRSRWTY